jgi:nucleoside permease NupC
MGYKEIVGSTCLQSKPLTYLVFSAWFFFKIMNISGAEAVVAAASPWIGQGESACLVRPYVDLMTESELHLTMTSGMLRPA